jgi:polyphosphate kinase 2
MFTKEDFNSISKRKELFALAKERSVSVGKYERIIDYTDELRMLQAQLVNLQQWIVQHQQRVAVIFEGRDAAGKGGCIKRFVEHLNPRAMRVVALNKPTQVERGQWFMRRYIKELPNPGEIVFFDRSWYNRAVVEPVMGFCTDGEYRQFMAQVPSFENMLYEDGVVVLKFWFSISKEEQQKRFRARIDNPLKSWKYSPVDEKGQELWDEYTYYKEQMFSKTHTTFCPWTIVKTNSKKLARLHAIRHVLSQFDFLEDKKEALELLPDPNIILRYHRLVEQIDT